MGKIYQVVVNGYKGQNLTIDLCNTEEQMQKMTLLQLKEKVSERMPEVAGEDFRLIFTDRALEGDQTVLTSYGIQHRSIIQMVLILPGGS